MQIHRVIVEIYRPNDEGFPGQVEEGQYTCEDGVVTLVGHDGAALTDRRGKQYTKKLRPEENPHVIAGRLLKQRFHDRGGDKKQFNRPLVYPPTVY